MSNYKNIRLEEHVYQELIKRMKPRESMSQVVERLLKYLGDIHVHARAIVETLEEDKG